MALQEAKVNSAIENIHSVNFYFKHDVIFNCKPGEEKIPCAICNILQIDKVDTLTMLIASDDKTEQLFQLIQQFVIAELKPIKYISAIIPFNRFKDFATTLDINRFKVSYGRMVSVQMRKILFSMVI